MSFIDSLLGRDLVRTQKSFESRVAAFPQALKSAIEANEPHLTSARSGHTVNIIKDADAIHVEHRYANRVDRYNAYADESTYKSYPLDKFGALKKDALAKADACVIVDAKPGVMVAMTYVGGVLQGNTPANPAFVQATPNGNVVRYFDKGQDVTKATVQRLTAELQACQAGLQISINP